MHIHAALTEDRWTTQEYTLTDTHLQSVVGWTQMVGVDVEPHANVAAWLKRCAERPALKKLAESTK